MSRIGPEQLIAYVDGELDEAGRRAVETAAAADPALAAELARHQALRAEIGGAFAEVLDEPVPERLTELIAAGPTNVVRPSFGGRPRLAAFSAIAASLVLGVFLGRGFGAFDDAPIALDGGRMEARGALAVALDDQLATEAGRPIRIGLTFRDQAGGYCRTFQMEALAGLACREAGAWVVRASAEAQPQPGEYRMAAAALPAPVLAAVDALIAGETLDAEAEARARARGWRD